MPAVAAAAPVLEFDVVIADVPPAGGAIGATGQPPPSGEHRFTASVTLGKDTVHVRAGESERLYDFGARVLYEVDHEARAYTAKSLHADVAFRESELANRKYLSSIVAAAGVPAPGYSAAELESTFGMPLDGDGLTFDATEGADGATAWTRPDGAPLASLDPGRKRVPRGLRDAFRRFVVHEWQLAPQIRAAVLADGAYPDVVTFAWVPTVSTRTETWTLTGIGRGPAVPPAPPDDYRLRRGFREDVAALADLVHGAPVAASAEALADLEKRTGQSIALDRPLDAFLAGLEFTLQRSGAPQNLLPPLATAAVPDPRLDVIMGALEPTTEAEARLGLKALRDLRGAIGPHDRVLDIFAANLLVNLGEVGDGYALLRGYLTEQPHSAGPLHYLGLVLYGLYEHGDAWVCFELARHVDPEHQLVRGIDGYEQALVSRYPEFY